jgi:nitroreductase
MEQFIELVKKRYSVRSYLDRPVEEEKLDYILECGRLAPSAANLQPWLIYVVKDRDLRMKLDGTYGRDWIRQAPVLLVFCGDHAKAWKRPDGKDHTDIDVSILINHITLAAAEQDLGTCWICHFDAVKCRDILKLPEHIEPIAYLPLGYPANILDDRSRHLVRKTMTEIIKSI